jgi:peptide deformylase
MILDIVKYPDPVLKKVAKPIEKVDAEVQKLIDDMYETMYAAPGVGLAAPQVAISKRILVIDVGLLEKDEQGQETHKPDPKAIINPIITIQEGKILWDEGCLSLPQLIVPMERSKRIVVEGLDREGRPVKYLGENLLAVAFQHEIDHLDGKLIFDQLSRLKQDLYKKKLTRHERYEETEIEHGSGPTYVG